MKGPSIRQILVYLSGAVLILLADPWLPTFIAGAALVAIACAIRLWAFGHLDKNKAMVTTGPYAYTRNPAYFGSFLAMVGVILACGNPHSMRGLVVWGFGVVLAIAFFAIYLPRKFRREYGRLEAKFGDAYERHAENVPHFWPRLTPWRSGDDRSFSWRLAAENNELPWAPALAVLLALVWFVGQWAPLERLFG